MIKSRKDLRFFLKEDAKRNGIKNLFRYRIGLIGNRENCHIYRYIRCLRFCEYYFNNSDSLINKFLYRVYKYNLGRLSLKYNISVRLNSCGYGLRIMHIGGGTRVGVLKVGNYCGFNVGSLIGTNGSEDSRPTLGDYVAFGPGAKAFGKITIGNNVFVAPNAVITKDIPDNVIVGGVPAKIIKEKLTHL